MNPQYPTLFSPFKLAGRTLKNRIVMAPMTRSRAIGSVPNDLMREYYAQRSGAGLILTEGTSPSPNGLGYARIPGLFNSEQTAAWKKVTEAVHAGGSAIFVQLMHTGRISHPLNLPQGAEVVGPSDISAASTPMYTDAEGMQPLPAPRALRTDELPDVIAEFVNASKLALEAGFDGVELHAANGYLLEQFLHPATNNRTDAYGGSVEGRLRFILETVRAVSLAIGADRVGIRVSPYGANGEMGAFEGLDETFTQLATELGKLGIAYVHVVDHTAMGAPEVPHAIKDAIRAAFGGTIILSGGYDAERAESDLAEGKGELVAFGRPFLSNPDLPQRMSTGAALTTLDPNTLYTPGAEGYTDYPPAELSSLKVIREGALA